MLSFMSSVFTFTGWNFYNRKAGNLAANLVDKINRMPYFRARSWKLQHTCFEQGLLHEQFMLVVHSKCGGQRPCWNGFGHSQFINSNSRISTEIITQIGLRKWHSSISSCWSVWNYQWTVCSFGINASAILCLGRCWFRVQIQILQHKCLGGNSSQLRYGHRHRWAMLCAAQHRSKFIHKSWCVDKSRFWLQQRPNKWWEDSSNWGCYQICIWVSWLTE